MKVTWDEIADSAGPPSMEVRFTTSKTGTDFKAAITNSVPMTRIINKREKRRRSVRLLQWGPHPIGIRKVYCGRGWCRPEFRSALRTARETRGEEEGLTRVQDQQLAKCVPGFEEERSYSQSPETGRSIGFCQGSSDDEAMHGAYRRDWTVVVVLVDRHGYSHIGVFGSHFGG